MDRSEGFTEEVWNAALGRRAGGGLMDPRTVLPWGLNVSREVWGTFSVKDHCARRAFVAEVLLYDRLVIPYPPAEERKRWADSGWEPQKLDCVLKILDDRWDGDDWSAVLNPPGLVRPVLWNASRQAEWATRQAAAAQATEETAASLEFRRQTGYIDTAAVLAAGLPRYVTGIVAVADYSTVEDAQADLGLAFTDPNIYEPVVPFRPAGLPGGTVCTVIGREFLVPDDESRSDADLLRAAVDIAQDSDFRRKRANFQRWQREFIADGATDEESLQRAVSEMRDLLEDEHAAVRNTGIRTGLSVACLIGATSIGLLGPFGVPVAAAVAAGGAFLSVGQFVVDHWPTSANSNEREIYAMFRSAQRRLGWDAAAARAADSPPAG